MADPELIKDIRPYVEFILSIEQKQINKKLIAKDFKEAISAEQGEDNEVLMEFLLELTQKYPEYDYDETIDKLKSGELTIQEGVEEIGLLNSKEEIPAKVSAEVPGEVPGEVATEVPGEAQVGVTNAEAEAGNEDENDGFLAPPNFNDEEEEEEEENENEENENANSVTPDESEGIAKPAVVPLATEDGRAAMVAQEGCKKGLPVRAKPTLAQGDCFYSSIYRSAGEAGLLQRIQECLGVEIDTEDNFVESMRGVVASKVLDGQLPSDPSNPGQDTFDILKEQVLGGLWYEVLKAYPSWFVKDYKRGLPPKERFLEKFAARVATRTLLVSQIEVTMVENALEGCGIKINKQNHEVARGIPGALNLWNQGEYHWVYFSFDVPADYEQTEEFLKKEYEDCQRECRGIKTRLDAEKRHQEEYIKFKKGKNPKFEKRKGRVYTGGTPPVGSRKKNKRRRITKKKK